MINIPDQIKDVIYHSTPALLSMVYTNGGIIIVFESLNDSMLRLFVLIFVDQIFEGKVSNLTIFLWPQIVTIYELFYEIFYILELIINIAQVKECWSSL